MPVMAGVFALLFVLYTLYRVLNSRTGATLLHILLAFASILTLALNAGAGNMGIIIGIGVILAGVVLFIIETRRANPELNRSQGILTIGVSILLLATVLIGPVIEERVSQLTLDGVATAQEANDGSPTPGVVTATPATQPTADALSLVTNTPEAIRITVENPLPTRYVYTTPIVTATTEVDEVSADAECEGVVQNNLNLRANPSVNGQLILTIPSGETVPVYARKADASWLYTAYEGNTGWVSTEYVALNAGCEYLPLREAS